MSKLFILTGGVAVGFVLGVGAVVKAELKSDIFRTALINTLKEKITQKMNDAFYDEPQPMYDTRRRYSYYYQRGRYDGKL